MSYKPDNPPAFPNREEGGGEISDGILTVAFTQHHTGMTLRDYFAGQALCGQLESWLPDTKVADGAIPRHARLAYEFADAMLAEREISS